MEKEEMMKPFNRHWWLYMTATIVLMIIYIILGQKCSYEIRYRIELYSGIFICIFLAIYKFLLSIDKDFDFVIWNELPLQVCNINAILIVVSLLLNNTHLQSFVLCVGPIGALTALITPDKAFNNIPAKSIRCIGFYGYHNLLVVFCFGMLTLRVYHPVYIDALYVFVFSCIFATIAHCINVILRKKLNPESNFFFTYGIEGNPVSDLFKRIIPYNLFFVLPGFAIFSIVQIIYTFIFG